MVIRLPPVLVLLAVLAILGGARGAHADVLIRWDGAGVPPREALGLARLVVPAERTEAVKNALSRGYDLYLEVDAARALTTPAAARGIAGLVLRGPVTPAALQRIQKVLDARGQRTLVLDRAAKWPHIRTNWVTKNNDVLQVTGRSAQPWIENNVARIRIAAAGGRTSTHAMTYEWKPIAAADASEGPRLENYLVAIAETGSFGGTLVLPIHARFQQQLMAGDPRARADWTEIRRYLEFYSWDLANRYRPITDVAVLASDPDASFEVMNLLARHNLPFHVTDPARRSSDVMTKPLVILMDPPGDALAASMTALASGGQTAVLPAPKASMPWHSMTPAQKTPERTVYEPAPGRIVELSRAITDPDAFALEMRQLLGPGRRTLDVWNGITVLAAPFRQQDGEGMMVTIVNYAHQPMPIQVRVLTANAVVYFESPEQPAALLPRQVRGDGVEFLLPALRVGGRIFLFP